MLAELGAECAIISLVKQMTLLLCFVSEIDCFPLVKDLLKKAYGRHRNPYPKDKLDAHDDSKCALGFQSLG